MAKKQSNNGEAADKSQAPVQPPAQPPAQPKVNWDDSAMQTTYANVVNAASTREEVILLFGTNQSWKGAEEEVNVSLSNRVILNPYAAKRLAILLAAVVTQYENRFGALGAPVEKSDK